MSVNYEKLLDNIKAINEMDVSTIDIKGNISIVDLIDIIGYCRIGDACLTDKFKAKVDKKLFKGNFLPAKFESFDYNPKTKEMKLVLHYYMHGEETYEFKRLNNGDIIVTATTQPEKVQRLLELVGDLLDDLCEYKEETLDYLNLNVSGLKSTNTDFVISMTKDGLGAIVPGLSINATYNWANCAEYAITCDSLSTSKLLRNNEENFLKKIRVNISDCPEWMRDELEYRNKKEIKKRELKEKNNFSKLFRK